MVIMAYEDGIECWEIPRLPGLQAAGVKRLGPIEMYCSSKTGSNKARKPDGNSTKQLAWPSHVARRELELPARDRRKLGRTVGICALDVSGRGSLPCKR
jgi:hypothetical protein